MSNTKNTKNKTNTLKKITAKKITKKQLKYATSVKKNIPIYDCTKTKRNQNLKDELTDVLLNGPGVFVLQNAYNKKTKVIDDVTNIFEQIIKSEKRHAKGDHFATGNNDRVWNSIQKLCQKNPRAYVRYHSNPWITFAAEAWLGPAFQVTAQVNVVRPGGKSQSGHCDYHLGFMSAKQVSEYPEHIHHTSAQLTLQGGIAHCDMPVEAGTTKLLPFSQNWKHNYQMFRTREVAKIFEENCVQLSLKKGDLMFFSPGLLHAAGQNKSQDIVRMVNLLQISSSFGRAMETVDRSKMCVQIFEETKRAKLSKDELRALIKSTAEGYPFPTNLDRDPPVGGLAPKSQQQIMSEAVNKKWTKNKFVTTIKNTDKKRLA